jgi:hypothetical protein
MVYNLPAKVYDLTAIDNILAWHGFNLFMQEPGTQIAIGLHWLGARTQAD